MTSADRRRLLFILQRERRKGSQAWEQLCQIENVETSFDPHAKSEPKLNHASQTIRRAFRLRLPRPDDISANN